MRTASRPLPVSRTAMERKAPMFLGAAPVFVAPPSGRLKSRLPRYEVQRNDTTSRIAALHGVSVTHLISVNRNKPLTKQGFFADLAEGEVIRVPIGSKRPTARAPGTVGDALYYPAGSLPAVPTADGVLFTAQVNEATGLFLYSPSFYSVLMAAQPHTHGRNPPGSVVTPMANVPPGVPVPVPVPGPGPFAPSIKNVMMYDPAGKRWSLVNLNAITQGGRIIEILSPLPAGQTLMVNVPNGSVDLVPLQTATLRQNQQTRGLGAPVLQQERCPSGQHPVQNGNGGIACVPDQNVAQVGCALISVAGYQYLAQQLPGGLWRITASLQDSVSGVTTPYVPGSWGGPNGTINAAGGRLPKVDPFLLPVGSIVNPGKATFVQWTACPPTGIEALVANPAIAYKSNYTHGVPGRVGAVGDLCTNDSECPGLSCGPKGSCIDPSAPPGQTQEGGPCSVDSECAGVLLCYAGSCTSAESVAPGTSSTTPTKDAATPVMSTTKKALIVLGVLAAGGITYAVVKKTSTSKTKARASHALSLPSLPSLATFSESPPCPTNR